LIRLSRRVRGIRRGCDMKLKPVWLALALLGSGATVAACEEESPVEDAAEDVKDAAEDVVDKTN
jgi:hypothetical protein